MRYITILVCFVLTACSSSNADLVEKIRNFEKFNENYAHTEFLAGHNSTVPDKFKKMVLDEMQKNLPTHEKGQFELKPTDKGADLVFRTQDSDLYLKARELVNKSEGEIYPLPGGSEMRKHIECKKNASDYVLTLALRTNF